MQQPEISVIIETCNESGAILELAANIRKGLSGVSEWEAIFADGSTNHTVGIIHGVTELDPRFKTVHFSNLPCEGYPSTVVQARKLSQGKTILYLNARRTYSSNVIALLAERLLEAKSREEAFASVGFFRGWLDFFRSLYSRREYGR
jgi:hypothetical protein